MAFRLRFKGIEMEIACRKKLKIEIEIVNKIPRLRLGGEKNLDINDIEMNVGVISTILRSRKILEILLT